MQKETHAETMQTLNKQKYYKIPMCIYLKAYFFRLPSEHHPLAQTKERPAISISTDGKRAKREGFSVQGLTKMKYEERN